jgi:hypothetical protein
MMVDKDKELKRLKKENTHLRKLLNEGLEIAEALYKEGKHWQDMYKQLNRICERENI